MVEASYRHENCVFKDSSTSAIAKKGSLMLDTNKVSFTVANGDEVISFSYPDFILFGQSSDAKLLKYGSTA